MLKWLYHKVVYRNGEHTNKSWLGGRITAGMSTNMNPGTWFVYFGKAKGLRLTISKTDVLGLALLKRQGFLFYHFLWRNGQIGWDFPWRKYAVGPKTGASNGSD